MALIAVFDFDQTICDTSSLKQFRDRRPFDYDTCRRLGETLPFYDGLCTTLTALRDAGVILAVASVSPRAYLLPFISRLQADSQIEFGYVFGHEDGVNFKPQRFTSGKSLIKAAQLGEIKRLRTCDQIVMIGDEKTDGWASKQAGIPFAHACWSSLTCPPNIFANYHYRIPSDISFASLNLLTQTEILPFTSPLDLKQAEGYTWARSVSNDVRIVYFDFYHKGRCYKEFIKCRDAMLAFKSGRDKTIAMMLEQAVYVIATDFDKTKIDCIVPIMSSSESSSELSTPVYRLAERVARRLGVKVRRDVFTQTPRASLSRNRFTREERYRLVLNNLRYDGPEFLRILLVDDVYTSGSTVNAYATRAMQSKSHVVGCVAVMKSEESEAVLNQSLYEAWANGKKGSVR